MQSDVKDSESPKKVQEVEKNGITILESATVQDSLNYFIYSLGSINLDCNKIKQEK